MTTESEVTLPDALAWLKSLSGDYAAKIAEFICVKVSDVVVELPAELELDLDGDTLKPSYQNAYVKGYNEALRDVEIKIEQAGITVK